MIFHIKIFDIVAEYVEFEGRWSHTSGKTGLQVQTSCERLYPSTLDCRTSNNDMLKMDTYGNTVSVDLERFSIWWKIKGTIVASEEKTQIHWSDGSVWTKQGKRNIQPL